MAGCQKGKTNWPLMIIMNNNEQTKRQTNANKM